jgi:uncharacterized protein (TIGR02391 family)
MPKKQKRDEPQSADLNSAQMQSAIPKLERRVRELDEFDVESIQKQFDPILEPLQDKFNSTLLDIFGLNTIEYNRYQIDSFDCSYVSMLGENASLSEVYENVKEQIARAKSSLITIKELFVEKLDDLGETKSGKALKALGDLELHPEIERAASDLFKNEHYANAIEDSCKALNLLVKLRSGRDDLDGTDLMQKVFSPNGPVLRFNEMQTDSEKSEQQGMMFLFAGAMLALRNPRAHDLIDDDPEKALESISFISFLAKSLDKTIKQ